ncbi:MerR family transcriptional regulator [Kaistia terrae]|uniref:MerR family transcriptional regulator n=1 Tax=Kaistia terrae TaxID=537017 RepID=A0ABW0PTI4_9HYPH|nr:MerR family transcriptional regulator [Kaistia terrae]MCX5577550.1 MerR family transcriptional regulator [Kaistia terrae]
MSKGPDAFRTISEVAEELDLPQHVLRFWETRFTQIKPMKRGGGRRYYRPDDVELLRGIRRLLYGEGYTIKGVQRILKEQGPRHVIVAGQGIGLDPAPEGGEPDDYGDDTAQDMDFETASEPDDFDVDSDEVDSGGRREPQFGTRAEPSLDRHPVAPSVHVSGERQSPPVHSRIPTAPPDLPSSAEDYLPPLVSESPMPPERSGAQSRQPSQYAPQPAPDRRDTHYAPSRAQGGQGGYDQPDSEAAAPASRPAERHAQPPAGLGHGDRERLQSTLMELLECKRILDNVR